MILLSVPELREWLESGQEHALFDVREAGEAHRGHIFGASFLPRRQIEFRIAALVPDRGTAICLVDGGGADRRARYAAGTLERLGYRQVSVLDGGTEAWAASGQILVAGSNVPSKLFGEEVQEGQHVPHIDVATLKQWQDEGRDHLVCDIRSPEEYRSSRIPGARGAFGTELARLAPSLRGEGRPIVVHCSGRTRSIVACQTLRLLGVPDVHALENGTMGWRLAGYPLERGQGAGVLTPDPAFAAQSEADVLALALQAGAQRLSCEQFEAWRQERADGRANVYLVDVRQVPEFVDGHVPGSIAVPGGLAIQRADEFVPVRAGRVVFIDNDETRSALAAYWYRQMGFAQVYLLQGGLRAWQAAGGMTETGRGREQPLGWDEAVELARTIAPGQLAQHMASMQVVNVDTSAEAAKTHLPGTDWIRYGDLEERVAAMSDAQRARLVLTCRDGTLSTMAAANLARAGWPGVPVLAGGVAAWRSAGFELEQGAIGGLAGATDLVVQPYDAGLEEMQRYLAWEQQLIQQIRQQSSASER
ncbi:rhodanese-like domain-containing protein [Lacisediminimonas profundi]|uniref:rhodanese-like domain-containing protein n=1 Tax=Lacisediminimonas profundi TaxID=2603856 RepID=UPI001386DCEE|nr:rhodanese-like domain-containing protein [Lacisediminimonas profundi]